MRIKKKKIVRGEGYCNIKKNCYLPKSSCVQCFKRPKIKISEFGLRKGLLIKKMSTEKMGVLAVPQIHLKRVEFRLLLCQKGKWEGLFCKTSSSKQNFSTD